MSGASRPAEGARATPAAMGSGGASPGIGASQGLDPEPEFDVSLVRPFTLTRGRTRNEAMPVPLEAIVGQSPMSQSVPPLLGPVETEIWLAAGDRLSSAEIASRLGLALGVVRVLVGDLVTVGAIAVGPTTSSADAQLVRRLIDGIHSL